MQEREIMMMREKSWLELRKKLKAQFGRAPDMNAILLLIGIRELGKPKPNFTKEEKQDLMHIATCRLLSDDGFYELEGTDQDGWPHWKLVKQIPPMSLMHQEDLLRDKILLYFEEMDY